MWDVGMLGCRDVGGVIVWVGVEGREGEGEGKENCNVGSREWGMMRFKPFHGRACCWC